jgi:site-specific DNA-methyltransferase (adenine-specific)
MGTLYFGDNLNILREHIKDESVDLIYLDPPFNSKRAYNLLFKTPKGHVSDAQITAFEDTWHWGDQAEREFAELLHQSNTNVAETMQALRHFLGENDVMAYLTMMANRLVELHRVLKSTGSLYLHCDPTTSHYLKIVLDTVFGPQSFRNEIIWKRRTGSSSAVHQSNKFGVCTDSIFFYAKTDKAGLHPQYNFEADGYQEYVDKFFKYVDENGRHYRLADLSNPAPRPNLMYEYKGYKPPKNGWAISREKMEQWDKEGRLYFPKDKNGRIQRKRFLDELKGKPVQSLWDDIEPIGAQAAERLGYPTQKPLALLERIINASSNPGDLVLDPFCGCGTAVHAAQKLGRDWIGIDITHLAISLIEKRLKSAFPSITFEVFGTPKDFDGAKELAERSKYEFQWWACALVNAQPYKGKKKGADTGIDGIIYFQDDKGEAKKIIVSVKSGENVTRTMIADLKNTVEREKAQMGLFVTLATSTKPMIVEATSAGFYESPAHGAFPKIQILSIEGLLSGKETPLYPDLSRGGLTFKKAKTETENSKQSDLL